MTGLLVFMANILALAGIYAILSMILNMEAGWGGLWDLGVAGLLAVGAYAYVILTVQPSTAVFAPGWPIWAGIVGASLFTGFVAFLIGLPALRMRGEFFLITTETAITMGAAGFHRVERPLGDLFSSRDYNFVLATLVGLGVVATYLITARIGRSPFGRLLRAQRDNEPVAHAVGKNVWMAKLQVFVLAGLMIGAMAPLYVWYIRSVLPSLFHPALTFTVWTAMVIGGIGHIRGPILGAFILIALTEATQFLQVAPEYAGTLAAMRPILIGLALIVIMRLRPEGLLPEERSFRTAGRGRTRGRSWMFFLPARSGQ